MSVNYYEHGYSDGLELGRYHRETMSVHTRCAIDDDRTGDVIMKYAESVYDTVSPVSPDYVPGKKTKTNIRDYKDGYLEGIADGITGGR